MPSYKHPGIYVEEIPGSTKLITAADTCVAAFVGKARKGPVNMAERIQSFNDYKGTYGDIASEDDTMGLAVQSFYLNGGKSAVICRLDGQGSEPIAVKDYTDFYENYLEKIQDINIVVVPGEYWPSDGLGNPIIRTTLSHCEKMKNRIVIIDPPPDFELGQAGALNKLALPASSYSVLYYPWVKVVNPFYNTRTNSYAGKTVAIGPSSFAAGIWCRTDRNRGVWKAPAGMEAMLVGAAGLNYKIGHREQDELNPFGVNCIKPIPRGRHVIWGARTLASNVDPQWRYISIRRTAMMIEQSIYKGIRWAVFEPSDHHLWSALRLSVGIFLNDLFRAGAFQGAKPSDAYFVRCGLNDTMTPADIAAGHLILIVGVAMLKPSEFTIFRIQQSV
jgi:Bacteriophage tail sheath protein